jgi:hypothetical protein
MAVIVIHDPLDSVVKWNFHLRYGNKLAGLNNSEILGLLWRDLYLRILRDIEMYNTHSRLLEKYYEAHQTGMKEMLNG